MMIAWAKGKWVLYVPFVTLCCVVLTVIAISFFPVAVTESRQEQYRLLWVVLGALIVATVVLSRFVRRRADRLIVVRPFVATKSLLVTDATRISARLVVTRFARGGGDSKYIFEVIDTDDTALNLATGRWGYGTNPDRMGMQLAGVLGIPLADGVPGIDGVAPRKLWSPPPPKDRVDRIRGWIIRHWILSFLAVVAVVVGIAALNGGVETRSHPRIEMPCAGQGFRARLRYGSFLRTDGAVSGDVNPGTSQVEVWDERRGCWARREVFVDLGQRLTVDCPWVLGSAVCIPESL